MKLLLWIVAGFLIVLVSSCDSGADDSTGRLGEKGYGVDIRWTSYGIPHVKAEDWGSLGYGFAYATAKDAVCVIARDVQMVNGSLSQYFGDSESNSWPDAPQSPTGHPTR